MVWPVGLPATPCSFFSFFFSLRHPRETLEPFAEEFLLAVHPFGGLVGTYCA